MDYTTFENYPLQILGIDDSYNSELNAISSFLEGDIEYTGEVEDLENILPYFVFYKFCENRKSEITAASGEQSKTAEFSVATEVRQVKAWNYGVTKLNALLLANGETANEIYTSKITMI